MGEVKEGWAWHVGGWFGGSVTMTNAVRFGGMRKEWSELCDDDRTRLACAGRYLQLGVG